MSVGVPLMEIVFAVHVAVTPSGKPIAVPIPVAPVVAWVIVVSVELTHKEGLEEHHLELLNQIVEQNHYAYDSKIIAKFSMKQTEMLTLKFKENMKIKDFCFIAIGLNP